MAVRKCPVCGGTIESWGGQSLRQSARQHYFIVHHRELSSEEQAKWNKFYNSLPKERS